MEAAIQIVIVHRKRLIREGLAFVLGQQPDMQIVAQVCEARDVLVTLPGLEPQVIVVDFALPERVGLAEARKLSQACPNAKILMIGMTELESDVWACIEMGAAGYLPHDASLEELLHHIRAAAAGEAYCAPKVVSFLFARIAEGARTRERVPTPGLVRLTRREREVIGLIEEGLSNKEIAVCLRIEVQTVKNHVHNILEKLRLGNRREAAQYAREHGLWRHMT